MATYFLYIDGVNPKTKISKYRTSSLLQYLHSDPLEVGIK